jgi:hypothetical protein
VHSSTEENLPRLEGAAVAAAERTGSVRWPKRLHQIALLGIASGSASLATA